VFRHRVAQVFVSFSGTEQPLVPRQKSSRQFQYAMSDIAGRILERGAEAVAVAGAVLGEYTRERNCIPCQGLLLASE
jgi:hypothetical protein